MKTRLAAVVVAAAAAVPAFAEDAKTERDRAIDAVVAAPVPPPPTVFGPNPVDDLYDSVQKWKKDNGIPINVGAWHWWHLNRHSPHDLMYGIPGLTGTYYYYIQADPQWDTGNASFPKVGAHVDWRLRDGKDSFRPFFDSRSWLWEAYGWVDTAQGRVKAGKVWKRFGLDWDGSWYGNVPYFDGYKLDPDWGVSWERSKPLTSNVKLDTFLQFFTQEDRVNGSITGADAESDDDRRERNTLVARVVPTLDLCEGQTLAVGLSALGGHIEKDGGGNDHVAAGAIDATWTMGRFKAFGEFLRESGTQNAAHYATGGPSDRTRDLLAGVAYVVGPATLRATWSSGSYRDPGGDQDLYLLGTTLALTKNVDFYIEYVRWNVHPHGKGNTVYEDGIQFVLNWRF